MSKNNYPRTWQDYAKLSYWQFLRKTTWLDRWRKVYDNTAPDIVDGLRAVGILVWYILRLPLTPIVKPIRGYFAWRGLRKKLENT